MRKTLIAALAVLAMTSGQALAQGYNITLKGSPTPAEQAKITAGLNAFMLACEPLFRRYWGDVVKAEAQLWPTEGMYTSEWYGWTQQIEIAVKIIDNPKLIPKGFYAGGHTLHYYVGAGKRPGLSALKEQSALVCGMRPTTDGSAAFKDDAGFVVLGR